MNSLALISEPVPPISELAEIINREHAAIGAAAQGILEHAMNAGDALLAVRGSIEPGQWSKWLEENTTIHANTAGKYMRVAHYRGIVQDYTGLQTAIEKLKGLPPVAEPSRREWAEDAQRLRDKGMPIDMIASLLGLSYEVVRGVLKPETASLREKKRRANLAQRVLEKKNANAKRMGGGVSASWSSIHLLMEDVDSVARNGSSPEIRRAFNLAYHELAKAKDYMARVL